MRSDAMATRADELAPRNLFVDLGDRDAALNGDGDREALCAEVVEVEYMRWEPSAAISAGPALLQGVDVISPRLAAAPDRTGVPRRVLGVVLAAIFAMTGLAPRVETSVPVSRKLGWRLLDGAMRALARLLTGPYRWTESRGEPDQSDSRLSRPRFQAARLKTGDPPRMCSNAMAVGAHELALPDFREDVFSCAALEICLPHREALSSDVVVVEGARWEGLFAVEADLSGLQIAKEPQKI